jgi:hypothetical protein
MNIAYLIYQAERPRSAAERRNEDINRGELARLLSRVVHGRGQTTQVASPRPALTLIKGSRTAPALAARVPAQRDHRTAC